MEEESEGQERWRDMVMFLQVDGVEGGDSTAFGCSYSKGLVPFDIDLLWEMDQRSSQMDIRGLDIGCG